MTRQDHGTPRPALPFEAAVLRHRRAKRAILTVLRDSPAQQAPERVLVSWVGEGEGGVTREVAESLIVSLEDLLLVTRESNEYGDVLLLTHRGWEVAQGVARVPSIGPPEAACLDEPGEPTPVPSFEAMFDELTPAKKKPLYRWRRPLVIGALVATGFFGVAVYWHDLRLALGSYAVLAICGLLVLLVDAVLLLPIVLRPVRATARVLDGELAVEQRLVAKLSGARLRDLEERDARLATDIEVRQDRDKLLAFGTAAAALVLAVAGTWSGAGTEQQAVKDLGMYINAGLLGLHIGAVAGLAATAKMRRLRFVLGRAIAEHNARPTSSKADRERRVSSTAEQQLASPRLPQGKGRPPSV